jgi:hypothetical protein
MSKFDQPHEKRVPRSRTDRQTNCRQFLVSRIKNTPKRSFILIWKFSRMSPCVWTLKSANSRRRTVCTNIQILWKFPGSAPLFLEYYSGQKLASRLKMMKFSVGQRDAWRCYWRSLVLSFMMFLNKKPENLPLDFRVSNSCNFFWADSIEEG